MSLWNFHHKVFLYIYISQVFLGETIISLYIWRETIRYIYDCKENKRQKNVQ